MSALTRVVKNRDPYTGCICLFSGIGICCAIAGAGLGIAAETRSVKAKNAIYAFVGQNFPGASVKINTSDLKTAGTLAVVACFLLFIWFIIIPVAFIGVQGEGRDRRPRDKRNLAISMAIIAAALTCWLLGAVIAATVIYATKGPKIEGSLNGDPVARDALRTILGQLQSMGFTLGLEYRNIPRTLVQQAIVLQWLAWLFCFIATIFVICAAVAYKRMPDYKVNPVSGTKDTRGLNSGPNATAGGIEEKNKNEGPDGTATTTNNPYGIRETEQITREDV